MTTSLDVRGQLVETLELDLVGPSRGQPQAAEVLPYAPSRWYLTGFLVPHEAPESQAADETAQDELDVATGNGLGDDEETPERTSARKLFFPSSLGISVLVPTETKQLEVEVLWGDYAPLEATEGTSRVQHWQRTQQAVKLSIPVARKGTAPAAKSVPGFEDLKIVSTIRKVNCTGAPRCTSVSLFLVNEREPKPDEQRDQGFVFQAGLVVRCPEGFIARPNVRGLDCSDSDEQVADLQFRDAYEYAVGHGISARAVLEGDACREVRTAWVPKAEVERVIPSPVENVDLHMEVLASCKTAQEVKAKLGNLPVAFGTWIDAQRRTKLAEKQRQDVAQELLNRAAHAQKRIADGLACLERPDVLESFLIANRTMAAAAKQRALQKSPPEVANPEWRPFQIAFLLMNLRGICDPESADREVVDLLFFPTGGGKTEAYLGLAAFALVLRRLRNPGVQSAGMSVLMRYTLRLLTLDQLGRAATLICALELERQKEPKKLGPWPFEVGLWVGKAATPNKMGEKGDNNRESARARTIAYKNDDKKPLPIPIENCPWCGTKFTQNSFQLVPVPDYPTDLRIICMSRSCAFRSNNALPILAVDEPIYRRLPCFLIATLDKFAALPWEGRVGALFGKVDRKDADGFYGPCDGAKGSKLDRPLFPPDLIIQDELHLISGPLGTMAGLYETAIDALSERQAGGKVIRPKVVASTATVRRAESQIQALFARKAVDVFPPPGPDRRDSFFAKTVPSSQLAARQYIGIAAPGRSLKVVLLRSYLSLLAGAQKLYTANGGDKATDNPADPYMTLVGYFSSLRELGGSRRIVEDEVLSRLENFAMRLRVGESPGQGPFANRRIAYDVVELTSREPNSAVARAKRRLELPMSDKDHVDVAIATNMISVGLDITRLGLMVVMGQPKMTAEYIQATSRVGRGEKKPGLVVTLLNVHRPRDRSHYERFEAYHSSFYRSVEATSVTPFSPRAVDRGLAAVAVGLARHAIHDLTAPLKAADMASRRSQADVVADILGRRAEAHAKLPSAEAHELRDKVRNRTNALLDDWANIADQNTKVSAGLQYAHEVGSSPPLLFAPLDPELDKKSAKERQFRANRSLRDVEPSVNLWVKRLSGEEVAPDEEED